MSNADGADIATNRPVWHAECYSFRRTEPNCRATHHRASSSREAPVVPRPCGAWSGQTAPKLRQPEARRDVAHDPARTEHRPAIRRGPVPPAAAHRCGGGHRIFRAARPPHLCRLARQSRGASGLSRRQLHGDGRRLHAGLCRDRGLLAARCVAGDPDGRVPVRDISRCADQRDRGDTWRHRPVPRCALGSGQSSRRPHEHRRGHGAPHQGRHRFEPVVDAVPDPSGARGAVLCRQPRPGACRRAAVALRGVDLPRHHSRNTGLNLGGRRTRRGLRTRRHARSRHPLRAAHPAADPGALRACGIAHPAQGRARQERTSDPWSASRPTSS